MKFGTSYSLAWLSEIGPLVEQAQALDRAGIDFVSVAGHVLSAPAEAYPGRPALTYVGPFRDPFVLFSYLSAHTQRLRFRTAILIAPLFPTALLAKQCADLAIVSGGRFDLGVGISWNEFEYAAMGQDLHVRGQRLAEQLVVLKRMWSEPYVSFEGRYHKLENIGIGQLPPQPVPILVGCSPEDRLLRRVARHADGWLPQADPTEPMQRLTKMLAEEGRDVSSFSVTGRLVAGPEGPDAWVAEAKRLQAAGVTELNLAAPPGTSAPESLTRVTEAKNVLARAL